MVLILIRGFSRVFAYLLRATAGGLLACLSGISQAADEQPPARALKHYGGEVFVAVHPQNFELAFQNRRDKREMTEYIPIGQTLEQWTEMITVIIFHGVTGQAPGEVQAHMDRSGQAACPGQENVRLFEGEERGYRVTLSLDMCGKFAESGLGEITLFKLIQGRDSFYQVQRALRVPPFVIGSSRPMTSAQLAEWTAYFKAQVYVCDTRVAGSCPLGLRP